MDRVFTPPCLDVLVFWVDFVAFTFFCEGPLGAPDTTRLDPRWKAGVAV